MATRLHDIRTYAVASALSVLVNLGAVGTFSALPSTAATARAGSSVEPEVVLSSIEPLPTRPLPIAEPPTPPPPAAPPIEPIRLGDPNAPDSESTVWMGVTEDAADGGEKGRFEQAEFKRGEPGTPDAQPAIPTPPAMKVPQNLNAPTGPADTTNPSVEQAARPEVAPEGLIPSEPSPQASIPATSQPATPAGGPNIEAPAASPGQNGRGDDRDSDATTIAEAVDARPGRPLSAKGLKIKTVAPKWTIAARLMWGARDPIVRVKFGRTGRVLHAEYVSGHGAGHPDISGPLLDAIYRWTAEGKELGALPATPADAGVTVAFRIILR